MPNFKFVDFSCNLLKIEEFIEDKQDSLIIYPTQNNVQVAQAYYQNKWQFEDILFIAIEDFTDMLLTTNRVVLEDDKRVIALYQLLTEEEKKFFQITDFFDFIKLANKIYNLFDELASELIDFSEVINLLESANTNIFPWQEDYYQKIYQLVGKYQTWLKANNLTDRIFLKKTDNIDLEYFAPYTKVYIVNQFYYTGLERKIIAKMEEKGKEVNVVYQLPEKFVDKDSLNALMFEFADLSAYNSQNNRMELIIDRNEFTMMNSLCRIISEEGYKQVIDRDFYESAYSRLLSPKTFDIYYTQPITSTDLYHFLDIIQELIGGVEYYNNQYFIPVHIIISAFLNKAVCKYFSLYQVLDLLEELYNLQDKGILYCDLRGKFGKESVSEALSIAIQKVMDLVESITKIRNISGLIDLFDTENGIVIDRLCSEDQVRYSNIKELVYTELANLKSYNNYNLIQKWSNLSDKAEYQIIFKLFCDGLKAKTVNYRLLEKTAKVKINSLLDTRNNKYESLIFLNMVEGHLPAKRSSQFLFNERQREKLGLKSYEEIRLREKYYFHRLVLTTKECYFLAIQNQDEDISISSFLEEVPLIKPNASTRQADRGYGGIFQADNQSDSTSLDPDFWNIKIPNDVFSNQELLMKLSYTKLKSLIDNPIYFLVRDWARVPKREIITEASLDYRFVGVFAQDYINHIIARIKDNFLNQEVFYKFQYMSKERLSEIYDSFFLRFQDKDYYIPHNYTNIFVNTILKHALVEGMQYFFNIVMHRKLSLSEKKIDLIPEAGFRAGKKLIYKDFITKEDNEYGIGIAVTGDADLRVENKEDRSKVVIDFKTGKSSKDQLALYQYIYYWDDIDFGHQVKAGIFQILKHEWGSPSKTAEETIMKLKRKVISVLDTISEQGFSLPASTSNSSKYQEITRYDLASRR